MTSRYGTCIAAVFRLQTSGLHPKSIHRGHLHCRIASLRMTLWYGTYFAAVFRGWDLDFRVTGGTFIVALLQNGSMLCCCTLC